MPSLAGFLGARLDEKERTACNITATGTGDFAIWVEGGTDFMLAERMECEVAANRAILAAYEASDADVEAHLGPYPRKHGQWDGLRLAVRHLAAVHSDHPDYDPAWAIDGADA